MSKVTPWYARNVEREQRQAALEAAADEILRRAERRPMARKPASKPPMPSRGWVDLQVGLKALRQRKERA